MRVKIAAPRDTSLSKLAKRRAQIYRVLAAAYAKPADELFLGMLRSWSISEEVLSQKVIDATLAKGLSNVGIWFEKMSSLSAEDISNVLSPEFTRLFRGLSRSNSPPPPYGSVYMDNGVLYGASTDLIIAKYRQYHLKVPDNEPPDHISLELDFMGFLCEGEAIGWKTEKGGQDLLKEQAAFVNEHLIRWVPLLCENIRKFDTTEFYYSLADITEGWLYSDQTVISGLLVNAEKV